MAVTDIQLDETEMALWNEPGPRGDAFRRATLDRAAEAARLQQRMVEVRDKENNVFRATEGSGEPDPEPGPPPAGIGNEMGSPSREPDAGDSHA